MKSPILRLTKFNYYQRSMKSVYDTYIFDIWYRYSIIPYFLDFHILNIFDECSGNAPSITRYPLRNVLCQSCQNFNGVKLPYCISTLQLKLL